ncbi:MAG: phosphoglycerate dehydrogenase [Pyrinomonadaceae bacterium]
MLVLVADKFETSGLEELKSIGCEVLYKPDLKDDALVQAIWSSRPDVLVVRSTRVSEAAFRKDNLAGTLKLVVRAGAGFNTIDVAAASSLGIYVSNCPGKNSIAVAELACGLMLALDRRIADNVMALRRGEWNKKEFSKAQGIYGQTLGLIGLGQIGTEVMIRARAFGLKVVAASRSLTPQRAMELGIEYKATPIEVAESADIVSVHLALTKDTRGLLGDEFFAHMRDASIFINTSRGEVVDQEALKRAMHEKGIRVGLDVFAEEPSAATGEFSDEIARQENLYGTHHIGASTNQAQEAIAAETVRIIRVFKETGHVPNVINLAARTPSDCSLVVRHRDRPGVLAYVLDAIKAADINVQEMENIVFEGAEAAIARISLEVTPSAEMIAILKTGNPDIIEIDLLRL